jgi:hypothetical protein
MYSGIAIICFIFGVGFIGGYWLRSYLSWRRRVRRLEA